MFANLKQGSTLYVFHKSCNAPFVENGTVETINSIPIFGCYPTMPVYPIDITVRIGDKVVPYKQLPANAETAEVTEQTTGERVTIASSRETLNAEISKERQQDIDIINSVDMRRQRIAALDVLYQQVNPEQAEKVRQANAMQQMQQRMDEMQRQMQEQAEINRQLLAKLKGERASSTNDDEEV